MSYNPNEIVKLKHLNEFAAQLGNKLDGNITKTNRTPKLHYYAKNENDEFVSPIIPNDGIINIQTDRVYGQSLVIGIGGEADSMPHILNLIDSDTANPVQRTETKLTTNWWTVAFQTSPKANITARTVTMTLHFDATTQYDAYDKDITFNITTAS